VAPVTRVLVANRAEIGLRLVHGCQAAGATAVAAHVHEEADAPYVLAADAATTVETFLDAAHLVAAARAEGCDALHPGYGFLSERAELAAACAEAGLTFIGPSAAALRRLGDKVAAREIAVSAGLSLVPGGPDATGLVFPVLVKAAAGGGGRGMRVVRDPASLAEAMAAAAREAGAAFGDATLYVERYLEGARHVEVQAFGDAHGGAIHLGLRDCSLQRRHQKVLEEAPAPGVPAGEVAALGAAACRLLQAVGYVGAATVELLRLEDGTTYFLEVNARLQVEHPVTEMVTGRDLVALQIAVARGERLDDTIDPHPRGHAVEARLIAEDPAADFLPTAGPLLRLDLPSAVRVDAGYRTGQVVPTRFDGLIGKLIAHGGTREEAFDRLREALDATVVIGIQTNLPLLHRLVRDPDVLAGRLDTGFVERLEVEAAPPPSARAIRAARALQAHAGRFRIGLAGASTLPSALAADGAVHVFEHGRDHRIAADRAPDIAEAARSAGRAGEAASIRSPMPGRVLSLEVSVGDRVEAGAVLCVLEAMKMEHPVTAPYDAVVHAVAVATGDQVPGGADLFVLGPSGTLGPGPFVPPPRCSGGHTAAWNKGAWPQRSKLT
jgi:acetyl-CoA/propionyl-CoA carboxylase, biotin carboxylase, biotin carboxyl carrier protein